MMQKSAEPDGFASNTKAAVDSRVNDASESTVRWALMKGKKLGGRKGRGDK